MRRRDSIRKPCELIDQLVRVDGRAAFVWVLILPIATTGSFAVPIPYDNVDDYNTWPVGVVGNPNIQPLKSD